MEVTMTMLEEVIIEEVTEADLKEAESTEEAFPSVGAAAGVAAVTVVAEKAEPEKVQPEIKPAVEATLALAPVKTSEEKTRKLAIICSKGTLDMAYPGLVLANAARMMGIDADLFFTFWGLEIIAKSKVDHLQVTPVGNPAMHMPQMLGVLPGVSGMATSMMTKELEKLDMPPVHEFLTMIHDAGAGIYACRMATDMMHLEKADLVNEVDEIIGAMEFLEKADGAQLLFI